MLKVSPIMLKIMLTLLHCAQHYAHLQCKKAIIKQLHTMSSHVLLHSMDR